MSVVSENHSFIILVISTPQIWEFGLFGSSEITHSSFLLSVLRGSENLSFCCLRKPLILHFCCWFSWSPWPNKPMVNSILLVFSLGLFHLKNIEIFLKVFLKNFKSLRASSTGFLKFVSKMENKEHFCNFL